MVNFEGLGTIPFNATKTDTVDYGREIYARAISGEFGPIQDYVRDIAREWFAVRYQRDILISQSDWTQLPDVQTSMTDAQKSAWLLYRKQLRDITIAYDDPSKVVWPTKP